MSEERLKEFAAQSDRTVQPIAASARRKGMMREELLSHLWETYQEELSRQGDESIAAELAGKRLGDEVTLRRELQASVPVLERIISNIFPNEEMVMSRGVFTIGCVLFALGFGWMFGLAILMPAMAARHEDVMKWATIALFVYSLAVTVGGVACAGYGFMKSRRSRLS